MNEQLNRFFELFLEAINDIHPEYYHTAYTNIHFQNHPNNLGNQMFLDGVLFRFGERVFSYELYHELRKLIDIEKEANHHFLENCFLQGELKKYQLMDILDHFGVPPLDADYIPDLLMHTPGSMDLNAFIIEIKVSQNLSGAMVRDDILKIAEFIDRYNYQRGIFLSLNTQLNDLVSLIRHDVNTAPVRNIHQEISQRIYLVTKLWVGNDPETITLNEVLAHE